LAFFFLAFGFGSPTGLPVSNSAGKRRDTFGSVAITPYVFA
jgi:hypothetical protein